MLRSQLLDPWHPQRLEQRDQLGDADLLGGSRLIDSEFVGGSGDRRCGERADLRVRHGYALPSVITNEVTDTVPPATIDTLLRFRSEPAVPTLPSITKVEPSDWTIRNHVAVSVAFADESWVIAFAVNTPFTAAGANAVALQVNSASRVVAAPPVAGRVPW